MKESTARKKASLLAGTLGVTIVYDHRLRVNWVYGPDDIYGGEEPLRDDPCDGDHTAVGGHEILDKVETYRDDLRACYLENRSLSLLEAWGFDCSVARRIFAIDNPECQSILAAALENLNDVSHRLVLADWLHDNGRPFCSMVFRSSVRGTP